MNVLKNKTILIMGAPGTGKGSYSKMLSKKYMIPVYSTGDHLRMIVENKDKDANLLTDIIQKKHSIKNLSKYLNDILNKGNLISKDIMHDLLSFRFTQLESGNNAVILDGYPRTVEQAIELESVYNRNIDAVINIDQDHDIITKKLLGRRNCSVCGQGYNICTISEKGYEMPSLNTKVENICHKCNGPLSQRSDDNEETIKNRLRIYTEKSSDILNYYSKKNVLHNFEMKKGFDDIQILYDFINREYFSESTSKVKKH